MAISPRNHQTCRTAYAEADMLPHTRVPKQKEWYCVSHEDGAYNPATKDIESVQIEVLFIERRSRLPIPLTTLNFPILPIIILSPYRKK